MLNLPKLFFCLVYPNFKGTCIEFLNGIMQVCWHFKKGLHWNCQGYFWKNSVKCKKQYKAPTYSIRKLTICIDNASTNHKATINQIFQQEYSFTLLWIRPPKQTMKRLLLCGPFPFEQGNWAHLLAWLLWVATWTIVINAASTNHKATINQIS